MRSRTIIEVEPKSRYEYPHHVIMREYVWLDCIDCWMSLVLRPAPDAKLSRLLADVFKRGTGNHAVL